MAKTPNLSQARMPRCSSSVADRCDFESHRVTMATTRRKIGRFRAGQITNKIRLRLRTEEKKWREPIRRVNPRRIEASWYVADRVRIRVDWPHDFDCRKSPMRNRIRSVENLAARNSEITDRLPYHQYVTVSVICNSWNLFNGDCRQLKPSGWPDNPRGWVDGLQTTATSLFQVRFSQARHLRLDKK